MIDFFLNQCKTSTTESEFWLADSQVNQTEQAYITTDRLEPSAIACVKNRNCIPVDFYAIDKCLVIRDEDNNDISLCDVMLFMSTQLIFVELKDKRDSWIEKSISQLESTITQFKLAHPDFPIKKRIAYAANKFRPEFPSSERERMREFKNRTGFRLNIVAEIVIN